MQGEQGQQGFSEQDARGLISSIRATTPLATLRTATGGPPDATIPA
jgi:hypothetical protein